MQKNLSMRHARFLLAIFSSLLCLPPLCRADNVVTVWGDNSWGQTNVPANLTNAVAVASGGQRQIFY